MFFIEPLFALGLTPMLAWLAVASAPILIHLWSRRRYRETSWAAMQYLLAAIRQSRRRMQLEQWLLLLLRTLVIVLIVLVFVEETERTQQGLGAVATERVHRVLVLDASYSMAYRADDRTRFERAKEIASRIVKESTEGDGFSLVLMAAPPEVIVDAPALQRSTFLKELQNVSMVHTSFELTDTLGRIEQIIRRTSREHPGLAHHEVYFLTDLNRVGWLAESRQQTELQRRTAALAQLARLTVIDLGQDNADNVAITSLRCDTPVATLQGNLQIGAVVKNFSQVRCQRQVDFRFDERLVHQEKVDLAPGESKTLTLSHRLTTLGDHVLEARLKEDRLPIDDHRWLSLPVESSVRVLCIDGNPAGENARGSTYYLANSLAVRSSGPNRIPVTADVAPESALLERDLESYDCVILSDIAQFTFSEARVLDNYLRGGGNLLVFLGGRVQPSRYNEELAGGSPQKLRILPARLGLVVEKFQARLDPRDGQHPIARRFRGRDILAPIHKYYQLILPEPTKAKVAFWTEDGSPFLVEEPIHRGHVVLVASSADASWGAMPGYGNYVSLVWETLLYCVSGKLQHRNLQVEEPLSATVAIPASGMPITVRTPDGYSEAIRLQPHGSHGEWTYRQTSTSGIYRVELGAPLARTDLYAVNLNTIESDLTKLTYRQFHNEVWPGIPFTYQTGWEDTEASPGSRASGKSHLVDILLYSVLLLLLVEIPLAWRFGHRTP